MPFRLKLAFAFSVVFFAPSAALAASQTFASPGTYTFAVPAYNSLSVQAWGAGGGGGGGTATNGIAGGQSSFANVIGGAGGGGHGGNFICTTFSAGTAGTASGGDTNTTGGGALGGQGGLCASAGGNGGFASKGYSAGDLTVGGVVTVVVGDGGAGGDGQNPGVAGAVGQVTVDWSTASPTCSITSDINPLAYGNTTTLHWSSTNANTSFYINNVGYVTPNTSGSATIGPLASTNYSGTAASPSGTGTCAFTENVTPQPPQNLTASCSSAGTLGTMNWSSSAGATAFSVRVDDTANGWAPSYCDGMPNDGNTGDICTPLIIGVPPYTFAATQNHNYTVWVHGNNAAGYSNPSIASINCAPTPPACSLSLSPEATSRGQSATLSWSSSNATSCTSTNFETSGAPAGSVSIVSLQSTTYTASCTGAGGTSQCSDAALSISCPISYHCKNASTITKTNSDCSMTSPFATCVAPSFCSDGISLCVTAIPSGTLSASPRLVSMNSTTRITWSTTGTVSCSVSGTNGDYWTGTSGSVPSSPMITAGTFTLMCDDADSDTLQNNLTVTVSVEVAPRWREM